MLLLRCLSHARRGDGVGLAVRENCCFRMRTCPTSRSVSQAHRIQTKAKNAERPEQQELATSKTLARIFFLPLVLAQ